jgi:23S rRNA (adenine2503-C2)-methyltransferase
MSVMETAGLAIKKPIVANNDLMSGKPSLIGLTREDMAEALVDAGVPQKQVKMRVSQLWNWLYVRGVSDFDNMTNVAKDLRETLKAKFTIARPEIVEEQISNDGTRKWLMRFPPRGAGRPVEIETVYIPEEGRKKFSRNCYWRVTGLVTSQMARRRLALMCRVKVARCPTS